MDPLLTSLPLAQGRKATALALASPARSPLAPDVPTFAEAGYPGFEFYTWYGLWGPPNLPANITNTISQVLKEIGEQPDVKTWFETQGLEYSGVGGAAFLEFSARRAEALRGHRQEGQYRSAVNGTRCTPLRCHRPRKRAIR